MDINWKRPLKLAFEIGMFSLGWLLIILVVSIAVLLAGALIKAFYTSVTTSTRYKQLAKQKRKKTPETEKNIFGRSQRTVKEDDTDLRS